MRHYKPKISVVVAAVAAGGLFAGTAAPAMADGKPSKRHVSEPSVKSAHHTTAAARALSRAASKRARNRVPHTRGTARPRAKARASAGLCCWAGAGAVGYDQPNGSGYLHIQPNQAFNGGARPGEVAYWRPLLRTYYRNQYAWAYGDFEKFTRHSDGFHVISDAGLDRFSARGFNITRGAYVAAAIQVRYPQRGNTYEWNWINQSLHAFSPRGQFVNAAGLNWFFWP